MSVGRMSFQDRNFLPRIGGANSISLLHMLLDSDVLKPASSSGDVEIETINNDTIRAIMNEYNW